MTRQQFKRIFLPILLGLAIVLGGVTIALQSLQKIYQAENVREIGELVGLIAENYPEVDTAEIIKILQTSGEAESTQSAQLGREILQKYGITEEHFASQNAAKNLARFNFVTIVSLVVFAMIITVYFYWRDWRLTRKVADLVSYIQDLSERVYDLRLEENSEDELSILSNELYKITVLLKESANRHRKLAENLEVALADISHQFKTPLTSLQIMIDEIYDDPTMPAKVRQDFLRSMSQQVQSMSGLTTTLLNLARLDNGTFKMHDRQVRIRTLLDNVKQKLEILAELGGVELEFSGDLDAKMQLDPRWQTEALSNIVKNAIEHSEAGKSVKISVEDCPLFLKIVVQDEGSGMTAHDMRHVFERFYRAQNNSKNLEQTSIGIGLAFAKAIVEADNGQITVDSELGAGSKFIVRYFR